MSRKLIRRAFMNGASGASAASLSDAPTAAEMASAINAINQTFADFREANDAAIAELRTGNEDVVRTEQVDRINAALTESQNEFEELNRRFAAASVSGTATDENGLTPEDIQHRDEILGYMRSGAEPTMVATVGSDPEGGYTVGRSVEAGIDRVVGTFGAMRQLATVRSIGSAEYRKFRGIGGATSGWTGEQDARPETNTPRLQRMDFPTHEIYANPAASQTLLDDAETNIEAWLADEVGIVFAEQESEAFIDGNGDGKPRGLIGGYTPVANASHTNSSKGLGYKVTGVSGGFIQGGSPSGSPADALIDLVYSLNRKFRQNGSFLLNDLTLSTVRKFKDADGNYIWQPSLQAGQPSQLLGYATNVDDYMDDIAADSFSIAFGDFRKTYLILDRVGVRVLRDPYTNKPNVHFYTTKRVGGGIQDFEATKLLKFGTS